MNIYYFAPALDEPCGGIRQIYRHVDILNANGFSAFVLHETKGFRCGWFQNETKIIYTHRVINSPAKNTPRIGIGFFRSEYFNPFYLLINFLKFLINRNGFRNKCLNKIGSFFRQPNVSLLSISAKDYLVVPELYIPNINDLMPGIKKIIFNQNSHYIFHGVFAEAHKYPPLLARLSEDVIAGMVVSEHSLRYMKKVFPELNVFNVHNGIDTNVFKYSPNKKKQIAFMPRKLTCHAQQVIGLLQRGSAVSDFEFVMIDKRTEKQTAEILKNSLIFLSFSTQEGCPLPPMEAMACGCLVVGYHGYGGQEYFQREFCYPVDSENILAFVEAVESVVAQYRNEPRCVLEQGKKASDFIQNNFSVARQERDVVNFWQRITKR
jgi:glycosyltransferase involved in cell wall biosynthesis